MKNKILKIFLIILLIIFILIAVHTIRNFCIITNLQNNIAQYTSKTNFHVKSITNHTDNTVIVMNYYEKDGKQKSIIERTKEDKTTTMSMYNNGERIDTFYDTPEGRTAKINSPSEISVTAINDNFYTDNLWQKIIVSASAVIKNSDYEGKKVYVVTNLATPYTLVYDRKDASYIEKDTGLLVKYEFGNSISSREYEFDNVTDSEFIEPDIGKYKVEADN